MRICYIVLGLFLSVSVVRAGAGPPPFTNGSPLDTGIDGTYNLIATGTNLTGVIFFTISNGVQAAGVRGWSMFADGQIVQGSVDVAISESTVAGVLNGGGVNTIPTNDDGSVDLPLVFVVPGNSTAGRFNGVLNQNSPMGIITGDGQIQGMAGRTDQIIVVGFELDPITGIFSTTVTTTPVVIPAGDLPNFNFKIRGTRQSTSALEAASASPSA